MKKGLYLVSLLTLCSLYGFIIFIILFLINLADGNILHSIGIIVLSILFLFFISPLLTDLTMKWFYKANFKKEIPLYLQEFIKEKCKKYKINYPKIGYIDDGNPNSFTYGFTKKSARIILTQGIFDLLNEEEIKAVVAHEFGHIVHCDMAFMTILQIIPLFFYAIFDTFYKSNIFSRPSIDEEFGMVGNAFMYIICTIMFNILRIIICIISYTLYIICHYIILFLSRTREYYADNFSIEETKNPTALAEALVKIGFGLTTHERNNKLNVSQNNVLGICDISSSKSLVISCYENGTISKGKIKQAMKWEIWNPWAKLYELTSTHPLISKRLLCISNICPKYNQEEYIKFDLVKKESYIDDFLLEVFLDIMPLITIIITLISMIIFKNKIFVLGMGGVVFSIIMFILHFKSYKNKNFNRINISNLLGIVKVSKVSSVPCELEGNIIGKGNPGHIFNEDFVIKDSTGIMFLDYNQPLFIIDKIFALFKSKEYINKKVIIRGWYRREYIPYIEIKEMEIDGQIKSIDTHIYKKIIYGLFLILSIILIIVSI